MNIGFLCFWKRLLLCLRAKGPDPPKIMACIGTFNHFSDDEWLKERIYYRGVPGVLYVVWFERRKNKRPCAEYLTGGPETYIISPISPEEKVSTTFVDCLGLVVAGTNRSSKEEVSFLCHIDPKSFLNIGVSEKFESDLELRAREMKSLSETSSVDAVIFGGNYFFEEGDDSDGKAARENYVSAIRCIARAVSRCFGIEAVVSAGPKAGKTDDAYYDTAKRRLFIIRPEVGLESTKSFSPSVLEQEKEKWLQMYHS